MLVEPDVPLSKFPSSLVENEAQELPPKSGQVKLPLIGVTGRIPPLPPLPVLPPVWLPPLPLLLPPLPPLPVVVALGLTPAHPRPAATPTDKIPTDNRLDEVCRRIGLLRRFWGPRQGGDTCPGQP